MDSLKKILLIDGDQSLESTIKNALTPNNYKIIYAPTFMVGIQKAIQHFPDLVLYNTSLDPTEGQEIFKALQLSSAFTHSSFLFYKDKNDEDIKYLIQNNGNDSLLRSQNSKQSIRITDDKDEHYRGARGEGFYDLNSLFQLCPNGMFIFDKNGILSVNQMLVNLLKIKKHDLSNVKIDDLFEKSSMKVIKQWVKKTLKGESTTFSNQVIMNNSTGVQLNMNLTIYELKTVEGDIHFLGLLQALQGNNHMVNYQLANEVFNLLKRENIAVSEALEKKITEIIKQRTIGDTQQKKSFFTKRENEVLRLSMEGLSIKVIADKLSLSTRTVEKYRTKLMLKSGAKNIVEVIVFALKNNLVKI